MSYQANKLGDPNNLGFFATSAALVAAYPVGAPGYFALVGATDSFWVWDSGTTQWIDSKTSGVTAYVYIAYASDAIGTGFTMTFNPSLDYIAIKNTTVAIPAPSASDFTGLWKNYSGVDGTSFTWRGTYSGATAYAPNDAVYYLGSSYMCKLASTGNLPTNTTYFDLMASKGADGAGSGDVVGPASSVNLDMVLFDGVTGKLIKSGGAKNVANGYVSPGGDGYIPESLFPAGSGSVTTASGIISGGLLTINADPTKFDISAGTGWIIDNWTNPASPVYTKVTWTAKTAVVDTYRTTETSSTILLDSSGNVVQKNTPPTRSDYRDYIVIGKTIHPTLGNITATAPFQRSIPSADLDSTDLSNFIGVLASGVEISANGANLSINRSSGSMYRTGSNYPTSNKDPNVASVSSGTAVSFQYRYRNGAGGFKADASRTTLVPNAIDDGDGTLGTITNAQFIINRVYVFANGNTFIVPGQQFYTSLALARDGITSESPIIDPELRDASLRAFVITKGDASSLQDAARAAFISGGMFGQASTLGGFSGAGDVVGPATATDSAIVLFDATTGKLIKDSAKTIVTILGTDNTTVPTSGAVKTVTDLKAPIASPTFTGTVALGTSPTMTTPVITGLPTGTGVSSANTASTLVARDANKNIAINNSIADYTTTATAAGTTTLTVSSTYQQYFTGTTTQIVTLPVTSTLTLGHTYYIENNSTGAVTVNSSGANAVVILAAGTNAEFTCVLTSGTTAASWKYKYSGYSIASGKRFNASNTLTMVGTDGTTMTFPSTSKTVAANDGSNWTFASQASGDIAYASSATAYSRLPKGTDGQVLTLAGGLPSWAAAAGGGASFWTLPAGATRVSNTSFTVTGDQTTKFVKGTVIKWNESSVVKNGMVSIPSTFSTNTTVTIVGDTMASIDASSLKYALIGVEPFTVRFAVAGTIGATATNVASAYYASMPMRVLGADLQVGTAGTTNSTTIDINKAGTTMFTTKPTLATTVAVSATPFTADTATSLALNDKVTVDVDAIQTTAAIDLYIQLYLFPTKYNNL